MQIYIKFILDVALTPGLFENAFGTTGSNTPYNV